MPEPLDDRLARLRSAAVPPLAPAAAVRARGDQRRSRHRAVLAAAAALTAVGALGAVALTTGGSTRPDSLQPAPFASDAPPTQAPPSTAAGVDAGQLLTADAVATVLGGTWTVPNPDQEGAFAFVTACGEAPESAEAGLVRVLEGPGEQVVMSQVLAYGEASASAAAFDALVDEVERCPSRAEDSEDGLATAEHVLLGGLPGSGPGRVYGSITYRDCETCPRWTQHFSISRVGAHLALVRVLTGELDDLPPLADAAERRVRCADGGCEDQPQARGPGAAWSLNDAFLPPEQASEAEEPGWGVTSRGDADHAPLADPCGDRSPPMAQDVVETSHRSMGSRREYGGSNLSQEVLRYSSAPAAEDAFRLYAERYSRCPEVQDPHGTEEMTLRAEIIDLVERPDGARMVVRRIPCTQGSCMEHFSVYVFVVRAADAVTVVEYAISEDGDPAEEARALAAAVERHLHEVVIR